MSLLATFDPMYYTHPKVRNAGTLAAAFHTAAILYAVRELTDGHLTAGTLDQILDLTGIAVEARTGEQPDLTGVWTPATPETLAKRLVDARLLQETDHGYLIHDFADHQLTRDKITAAAGQIEQRRLRDRVRKRAVRGQRPRTPSPAPPPLETPGSKGLRFSSHSSDSDKTLALQISNDPEKGSLTWFAEQLRDADHRTTAVIASVMRKYRHPEAALHSALEALEHRRSQSGKPLVSEARYFVATLSRMGEEGQYRREAAA